MINAPVVLRTFLIAQTPLFTLTGNRIWEERVYPIEGWTPSDGNAICFRTRGGRPDYTGLMLTQSWMFKCYGSDESDAHDLYRTLFDVLHDKATGGMYHSELEIAGQLLQEGPLGWNYSLSFWTTIMMAQFEPV